MDIKQALEDLKSISQLIDILEETLEKDRKLYQSLSLSLEDALGETIQEISDLKKQRQDTLDLIDQLDSPIHKSILIERYLNGKKWKDVTIAISCSRSNTFREYNKAIEQLEMLSKRIEAIF